MLPAETDTLGPYGFILLTVIFGGVIGLALVLASRIARLVEESGKPPQEPERPVGWQPTKYEGPEGETGASPAIIPCKVHRLENCPWCSGSEEEDEDDEENDDPKDGGSEGEKPDEDDEDANYCF